MWCCTGCLPSNHSPNKISCITQIFTWLLYKASHLARCWNLFSAFEDCMKPCDRTRAECAKGNPIHTFYKIKRTDHTTSWNKSFQSKWKCCLQPHWHKGKDNGLCIYLEHFLFFWGTQSAFSTSEFLTSSDIGSGLVSSFKNMIPLQGEDSASFL